MQDAYNSYISGVFFVIYILMSNYFMQILTIGIIMQRFIELNDHKERQQIYVAILGMGQNEGEGINIEELKNKFRENEKKNKELGKSFKRTKTIKDRLSGIFMKMANSKALPIPDTPYYKYWLPQACWRL